MADTTGKLELIEDIDTILNTAKGKLFVLSDEISQSEPVTLSDRILDVVQRHKNVSLHECYFQVNTDVPESQMADLVVVNDEVALLVHLGVIKSVQEQRQCLVTEKIVTPVCVIIH